MKRVLGINRNNGYTFLEIFAAISIMAILLSFAVPSMVHISADNKIRDTALSLSFGVSISKQTAIAKAKTVYLCPTSDGNNCTNDWAEGFMSFLDLNVNKQLDEDEEIIFIQELSDSKITIASSSEISNGLSFSPDGKLNFFDTQRFIVCDSRGFINKTRVVIVTFIGYSSVYYAGDADVESCNG